MQLAPLTCLRQTVCRLCMSASTASPDRADRYRTGTSLRYRTGSRTPLYRRSSGTAGNGIGQGGMDTAARPLVELRRPTAPCTVVCPFDSPVRCTEAVVSGSRSAVSAVLSAVFCRSCGGSSASGLHSVPSSSYYRYTVCEGADESSRALSRCRVTSHGAALRVLRPDGVHVHLCSLPIVGLG